MVGINQLSTSVLMYHNPRTPLEAKFSAEFCVAAALAGKEINRETFSEAMLDDPEIRRLIPKITVEVDERVRYSSEHGSVVKVTLVSGRSVERLVELAKGKPERWLSRDELRAKFMDCAEGVLGTDKAGRAFETLQSIEHLGSIEEIIETLRPT